MEPAITIHECKPDLEGPHGKAWKMDDQLLYKRHPNSSLAKETTVCGYIVEAVWAHPLWKYYSVNCVSLKNIPGLSPAIIRMPGATHEIMVYALNPNYVPTIDDFIHILHPCNFAGQWYAASDEIAAQKVEETVKEIINGGLSPDTDFIRDWVKRFGDHCLKKG